MTGFDPVSYGAAAILRDDEGVMECPTAPQPDDMDGTFTGCGSTNVSEPDDEGIVDCLNCGIWFTPAKEA